MASIFTPKRVSVPGLLSDEGLAAGIAALKDQTAGAANAMQNTSGVEVAPDIANLNVTMPPAPGIGTTTPAPSTISLSGSPAPAQPQAPGFGMLTPEQGLLEQQQRIQQADEQVAAVEADNELGEQLRNMTDEQAAEFGIPRDPFATPEEQEATRARLAGQEAAYLQQEQERADFIRQAPPPNMTWWLNAAQVGARAAAQTGTSALKYPFSAFEALTYLGTGLEIETAPRGWIDEVDAALTKILPGDPSRAKDFVTELSAGGGSFIPFLIAGYLGAAVGLPAGVTAGGLGAAVTGNQMYEEAEDFDATAIQKALALIMGTGLGASEAVPIERMFLRADVATGGLVRRMLANTAASTVEEFTQEFSQAVGEDMIAKYGAGFDPDRQIDMLSWLRAGAVGGIVGGVAGGVTTLVPGPRPEIAPEQQTAAIEEVFNREQARFDAIIGQDPDGEAVAGEADAGAGPAPEAAPAPDVSGPTAAPRPAVVPDGVQGIIEAQAAFHGTPHRFDRFELSDRTIGTGEGAQAFGHGLYFAGARSTANYYRNALSRDGVFSYSVNGERRTGQALTSSYITEELGLAGRQGYVATYILDEMRRGKTREEAVSSARTDYAHYPAEDLDAGIAAIETASPELSTGGALYTVNLPDDAELLDWDTPLRNQPQAVADFVTQQVEVAPEGSQLAKIRSAGGGLRLDAVTGSSFYQALSKDLGGDRAASQALREAGIPGHRFLDGQSRNAGEGSHNYVIYDDSRIEITDIEAMRAAAGLPNRATIAAVQLDPVDLAPLPNIEKGLTGPIPTVVQAAKAYTAAAGLPHRRQRDYARVDVSRAARIAQAYADMKHEPNDPAVLAAYRAMADETIAQYQFVKATGLKIETIQPGQPDPYPNGPRDVLKDIAKGHIWYFPTDQGFGSSEFDPTGNPLLEATPEVSDNGVPMVVNDLFRVVHDFFGHGMEGAGFGARGEENAWQAHMRLYSAAAIPAMTSETRGQNSWVNYGPFGAQNRADPRNTVYADQKTGIMPSWTWTEGVADSMANVWAAPVETPDANAFREALLAAKGASKYGGAVNVYGEADYAKMRLFLSSDGLAGFALDGENIVSVFSRGGGRLRSLIDTAIANGGRTLDAFDTGLVQMYAALGFVETGRVKFDPAQAPAEWPAALGQPDVVFMSYDNPIERMEAWEDKRAKWHAGSHEYFKNEDGTPKVFYHGTDKGGFRQFDTSGNAKTHGTGAWFTPDRYQAASYGNNKDITFKDYDDIANRIVAGESVEIDGQTLVLERDEDGDYVRSTISNGVTFVDGPFANEQEVREWLNDSFEDDSRQSGVYAVYLRAKNPIIVDWGGANWAEGPMEEVWRISDPRIYDTFGGNDIVETFIDEDEATSRAEDFLAELKEDNPDEFGDLEVSDILSAGTQAGFQSTDDFVREMRENWGDDFDAIVLQNVDGAGPNGYGSGTADEIVIWDETSIKSTANLGTYDPNDPDILRMAGVGTNTTRMPFIAEPTRPARGVPNPQQAAADAEPNDVKLTAISKNLVKLLNLTARHGRLVSGKDTFGEYNKKTGTVRLRTWTDLSTLAHEAGHAINDSMAGPLNDFVTRNEGAVMKIAVDLYPADLSNANAQTRRREGFAEFFRVYTLTPQHAHKKWPEVTKDFEATLRRADPAVLDGLNAISAQFNAWLVQPSTKLIRNMVVDGRREQGINAAVKELKELGFKTWMQEHVRRSVDWSTNRFAPLNQLVTELLNAAETNTGGALDLKRADDPRTLIRLARNAGSRAMVEVTDGVYGYRSTQPMSRSLRDALMLSQGVDPATTPGALDEERMKDFGAYLVARRSLDEFERFEQGLIDRPPIGASKGDILRAIKDYEKQYGQSFTDAADIAHEYGMALWQKQYDAGLMTKETYQDGLQRKFYVPLQRDMSDKKAKFTPNAVTGGNNRLTSIVKRFRGSDRDIIDPMAILMQKTFALETLIAENDAVKALALLADKAGRVGALVERIPATQVLGLTMSVEDAARQLSQDDTLSPADAQDLMTLLGAAIKDGNSISLFRRDQVSTAGENILFFWENGRPAAIQLKDGDLGADVVNTIQGIGRENLPLFTGLVSGVSSAFRSAVTSWPDFLIVNYIRDQMSAWVLNDVGFVPFVSGIKGVADEVRQKQWAKSYNAAQGIMGGMNVAALHEARVDRDIRALRSKGYLPQVFSDKTPILGALRGFGRLTAVTETGTRLGLYRASYERSKADGLSDYEASVEAAYLATDYIDFGLNGSRMLLARRTIPFLNAQLQGLYKMLRTLGGDEVAQRKGLKFVLGAYFKSTRNMPLSRVEKNAINTGRKAWLKMASLGLISALLHLLFRDDPDYQEAGEYLRVTGWVIPLHKLGLGKPGSIFYGPKPFELALMANAIERGLEFASGDSTAADRFLRGAAMSLVPPTSPTSIQLAVEITANHDFFTGREIVPSYMQAMEPAWQYDNNTSSFAKWMGQTFGWSPLQIDHVMSGLGASAFRDIAAMTNAADPTRPAMDETDAPLLRRFVRDVRRGSVTAQDFWGQASQTTGRLERASQTYKRFVEYGNEVGANEYLATLSTDEQAYALLMTHFEAEDKRLNPFYRARQVSTVVSGMRREMASELGLGDTLIKDMPAAFEMSAGQKQEVDEILSEIARREMRNTLIATNQAGWADKEILPLEPTLDLLMATNPDVYDEFVRRRTQARIYDAETVFEYWPDVRERLVMDREFAVLADARSVASVVF